MSSNPCIYVDYILHELRCGYHKRLTMATCGCMSIPAKVRDRGLGLSGFVCDDSAAEAAYAAIVALYKRTLPLPLKLFHFRDSTCGMLEGRTGD